MNEIKGCDVKVKAGHRGYHYAYRRLGYQHGKQGVGSMTTWSDCPAHVCGCCACSWDEEEPDHCGCGTREEYRAAYFYALGWTTRLTVSIYEPGGWLMSGDFKAGRHTELVDAWDMRSALKAARYLREGLSRGCRIEFTYRSRTSE
jgi:hypothetical protein